MQNEEYLAVVENVSLEYKLQQLDDIITHKSFVLQAGKKLITKLFEDSQDKQALDLLKAIMEHDNSKSSIVEFAFMAKSANENDSLKSPQAGIDVSKSKMKAIKKHWSDNKHHPEFYMEKLPDSLYQDECIKINMDNDEIAIMEMCCDWYARSLQFKTNVMDFWHEHSKKRWCFSIKTSALIEKYLTLLVED